MEERVDLEKMKDIYLKVHLNARAIKTHIRHNNHHCH